MVVLPIMVFILGTVAFVAAVVNLPDAATVFLSLAVLIAASYQMYREIGSRRK